MIEIIPAIIAKDFNELKKKIEQVENYVKWIQLDIMDGVFVPNETWNSPSDLKNIDISASLEAHLMVKEPEKVLDDWLEVVDRIIVHFEATKQMDDIIDRSNACNKKVGIAINPETPLDDIEKYLNQIDLVLCMTVTPGFGGQKFQEKVLEKIRTLRKIHPEINIEVDGGINPETAKLTVEAGANLICSGSFIFQSERVSEAIKELREGISNK